MLLTVKQAAERLVVSPSAIYDLIESRTLPHKRVGVTKKAIRIEEADLDRYLKSCEVEASLPVIETSKPRTIRPIGGFKHTASLLRSG